MKLLASLLPGRPLRRSLPATRGRPGDPFPTRNLVHFSYHKCLTVYFQRIMRGLADEFGFLHAHCQSNAARFVELLEAPGGWRFISLNNVEIPAVAQMRDYRGSHFIRDPRDLVVSGYRYHLWTEEKVFRDPGFDWSAIVADPWFAVHVEPDPAQWPRGTSYLEYLNTLDRERGMVLETIRCGPAFAQMERWDFRNPLILEMRYEDIVGHEPEAMRALFDHYGLRADVRTRGLEIAEQFSLENQQKSGARHARNGTARQWEAEFSPRMLDLFNSRYQYLLDKLGYACS